MLQALSDVLMEWEVVFQKKDQKREGMARRWAQEQQQHTLLQAALETLATTQLEEQSRADHLYTAIADAKTAMSSMQEEWEQHLRERTEAATVQVVEARQAERHAKEVAERAEQRLALVEQQLTEQQILLTTFEQDQMEKLDLIQRLEEQLWGGSGGGGGGRRRSLRESIAGSRSTLEMLQHTQSPLSDRTSLRSSSLPLPPRLRGAAGSSSSSGGGEGGTTGEEEEEVSRALRMGVSEAAAPAAEGDRWRSRAHGTQERSDTLAAVPSLSIPTTRRSSNAQNGASMSFLMTERWRLERALAQSQQAYQEEERKRWFLERRLLACEEELADLETKKEALEQTQEALSTLQGEYDDLMTEKTALEERLTSTEGQRSELRELRAQVHRLQKELEEEKERSREVLMGRTHPELKQHQQQEALRLRLSGLTTTLAAAEARFARPSSLKSRMDTSTSSSHSSTGSTSRTSERTSRIQKERQGMTQSRGGVVSVSTEIHDTEERFRRVGAGDATSPDAPKGLLNGEKAIEGEEEEDQQAHENDDHDDEGREEQRDGVGQMVKVLQDRIAVLEELHRIKEEEYEKLSEEHLRCKAELAALQDMYKGKCEALTMAERLNAQYVVMLEQLRNRSSSLLSSLSLPPRRSVPLSMDHSDDRHRSQPTRGTFSPLLTRLSTPATPRRSTARFSEMMERLAESLPSLPTREETSRRSRLPRGAEERKEGFHAREERDHDEEEEERLAYEEVPLEMDEEGDGETEEARVGPSRKRRRKGWDTWDTTLPMDHNEHRRPSSSRSQERGVERPRRGKGTAPPPPQEEVEVDHRAEEGRRRRGATAPLLSTSWSTELPMEPSFFQMPAALPTFMPLGDSGDTPNPHHHRQQPDEKETQEEEENTPRRRRQGRGGGGGGEGHPTPSSLETLEREPRGTGGPRAVGGRPSISFPTSMERTTTRASFGRGGKERQEGGLAAMPSTLPAVSDRDLARGSLPDSGMESSPMQERNEGKKAGSGPRLSESSLVSTSDTTPPAARLPAPSTRDPTSRSFVSPLSTSPFVASNRKSEEISPLPRTPVPLPPALFPSSAVGTTALGHSLRSSRTSMRLSSNSTAAPLTRPHEEPTSHPLFPLPYASRPDANASLHTLQEQAPGHPMLDVSEEERERDNPETSVKTIKKKKNRGPTTSSNASSRKRGRQTR